MTLDPNGLNRQGRFGGYGGYNGRSDIEQGYQDAVQHDPYDRKFVRRNLRPYKTLRKFTKKGGLRKLRSKNYAQLEKLAVKAVLKKNKVKMRKLKVGVNKTKYGAKNVRRAKRLIRKRDLKIRNRQLGQLGKGPSSIQNRRLRRAAKAVLLSRRNRRINKSGLYKGRGYDIYAGHR